MKKVFFVFFFLFSWEAFCSFRLSMAPIFFPGETKRIRLPYLVGPSGEGFLDITYKEIHFFSTSEKDGAEKYSIHFGPRQEGESFKVKKIFYRFLKLFLKHEGEKLPFERYSKSQALIHKEFLRLHEKIVKVTRKKVLSPVEDFVESKVLFEPFHSFHPEQITP